MMATARMPETLFSQCFPVLAGNTQQQHRGVACMMTGERRAI
jgi:hypothetical protein